MPFKIVESDVCLKVQGIIICGTYDLPTKAHFLNMKQYNGNHGCQTCKQTGEQLPIEHVHVYPYIKDINMRTSAESLMLKRRMKNTKTCLALKVPQNSRKLYLII